MQPEGKLDLDKMAQRVQNLFKFERFYDQMVKQRLAITKCIIELADPLESYGLFKRRVKRNSMFEDMW